MELKDDALPIHEGRARPDPPAHLPRGQLLRRHPARLAVGRRPGRRLDASRSRRPPRTVHAAATSSTRSTRTSATDLQTFLHEYGTVALAGRRREGVQPRDPVLRAGLPLRRAHERRAARRGSRPRRPAAAARASRRRSPRSRTTREALKELVTDLNTTAGAIARQDAALEASVPALRDTLRDGLPGARRAERRRCRRCAPSRARRCRACARRCPTLDAAIPWFAQARGLVQQSELKGLAADLRQAVPEPREAEHAPGAVPPQLRALSSCTNHVLVPFMESDDPEHRGRQLGPARARADQPQLRGSRRREPRERRQHAGLPHPGREPGQPRHRAGSSRPRRSTPNMPPPHRPDVPCETQEPPNLNAPGGDATLYGGGP